MFGGVELPDLSYALPLQSERHWSDMLAVLIASDPVPLGAVLGRRPDPKCLHGAGDTNCCSFALSASSNDGSVRSDRPTLRRVRVRRAVPIEQLTPVP